MSRETKIQAKRRLAYYRQLRKCGFRSWKAANKRRHLLIFTRAWEHLKGHPDRDELDQLGKLVDLLAEWKTNGQSERRLRAVKRLQKKLERQK